MTDTTTRSPGLMLAAAGLFIGVGLVGGGYFVSRTMVNSALIDTAEVKGLAERTVSADQAIWSIGFQVSNADLKAGYAEAQKNSTTVRDFLLSNGFPATAIVAGPIGVSPNEFRDANGQLVEKRYDISGAVILTTTDVKAVEAAAQKTGDLIAAGLVLTDSQPRYLFTGLNSIKPEMLRDAAQAARTAADEFAKNAGAQVGAIRSAAQGGFEVHDRDSADTGTDDRSIDKTVRVVTNVTFYLD